MRVASHECTKSELSQVTGAERLLVSGQPWKTAVTFLKINKQIIEQFGLRLYLNTMGKQWVDVICQNLSQTQ